MIVLSLILTQNISVDNETLTFFFFCDKCEMIGLRSCFRAQEIQICLKCFSQSPLEKMKTDTNEPVIVIQSYKINVHNSSDWFWENLMSS